VRTGRRGSGSRLLVPGLSLLVLALSLLVLPTSSPAQLRTPAPPPSPLTPAPPPSPLSPAASDATPATPAVPRTELPGPRRQAELDRLTDTVRRAVLPLRVDVPVPPGLTYPVSPDRRGWAVQVRGSDGQPHLLVPLAFVAGARHVAVDAPGAAGCLLQERRRDLALGLAELAPDPAAAACTGSGPSAALTLLPPLPTSTAVTPPVLDLYVLPGLDSPAAQLASILLFGTGHGGEEYYLLHSARWALAAPLVDGQGRLVGIACGPSWAETDAGLAIRAAMVEEFLQGRSLEGQIPYLPQGQGPSWPPSRPLGSQ